MKQREEIRNKKRKRNTHIQKRKKKKKNALIAKDKKGRFRTLTTHLFEEANRVTEVLLRGKKRRKNRRIIPKGTTFFTRLYCAPWHRGLKKQGGEMLSFFQRKRCILGTSREHVREVFFFFFFPQNSTTIFVSTSLQLANSTPAVFIINNTTRKDSFFFFSNYQKLEREVNPTPHHFFDTKS